MAGELRTIQYEPVTPAKGGAAPGWVVSCLDCTFSCDEHGDAAETAIKAVAQRHERSHRLVAMAVDYRVGYGPDKQGNHPLYGV